MPMTTRRLADREILLWSIASVPVSFNHRLGAVLVLSVMAMTLVMRSLIQGRRSAIECQRQAARADVRPNETTGPLSSIPAA
jgi:hypothetical protein